MAKATETMKKGKDTDVYDYPQEDVDLLVVTVSIQESAPKGLQQRKIRPCGYRWTSQEQKMDIQSKLERLFPKQRLRFSVLFFLRWVTGFPNSKSVPGIFSLPGFCPTPWVTGFPNPNSVARILPPGFWPLLVSGFPSPNSVAQILRFPDFDPRG